MKQIILALMTTVVLSACGAAPSSSSSGGYTEPQITYSLANYYSTSLEGYAVELRDLDSIVLGSAGWTGFSYTVSGYECTADVKLSKPGALNLYYLQVINMDAVNNGDPVAVASCDAGAPSNFWIRLTSASTMTFERAI